MEILFILAKHTQQKRHAMKIVNILIGGYKNISETEINLTHFNAIIALNNYGKSNLIEAIDFSNEFIKASNKVKNQMMQNQTRIPINNLIAGKDFTYEITFETIFETIKYTGVYSFSFEWLKNDNKGKRIKTEKLRLKKNEKDSKYFTYINRTEDSKTYLNYRTGRCDKKILIEDNALILNKLLNFDDLFYLEIIEKLNNLEFSIYHLDEIERRFSTGFTVIESDNSEEEPKMSEIPSIASFFYILKKEDKNKFELLINSIKDLLPDIEYITPIEIDLKKGSKTKQFIPFELPEKAYDIRVKIKTNNQETSVKNLSDGSKRIFYVLANVMIAEMTNCNLLTFEELENSIHPALLQRLLIIISELTSKTQILITSHSPHLVKYLDLDSIYIGIPNPDGVALFKKIKKSKQSKLIKYAQDADSNIGDFVFDMLLEGFNDSSFWNEFI